MKYLLWDGYSEDFIYDSKLDRTPLQFETIDEAIKHVQLLLKMPIMRRRFDAGDFIPRLMVLEEMSPIKWV